MILRAVKESRYESVDGVPHHRKVVALSPDALQRVPVDSNAAPKNKKPAADRFSSLVSRNLKYVVALSSDALQRVSYG